MNWLILISDIVFALVASILCRLGLSTIKAIKQLGIGKSFWMPVFLSGALFLLGSTIRIFNQVAVELYSLTFFAVQLGSLTIKTEEIVHLSWLLALCILMLSIYNYSKKVKTMRRATITDATMPDSPKELTPIEEQTADVLKRVEKLKKQVKDSEKVKTIRSPTTPNESNELTDQTTELLKRIEKLKKDLKD